LRQALSDIARIPGALILPFLLCASPAAALVISGIVELTPMSEKRMRCLSGLPMEAARPVHRRLRTRIGRLSGALGARRSFSARLA
jgi:hypothetical protein